MAQRYRSDVRTYSDESGCGLLTIGRGPAGKLEISFEVKPESRGRGLARRMALAARSLVSEAEPVFAGSAPGNAASIRALLAAGYVPICSEVCLLAGAVREAMP